jgi:hypothetical protein
MRKINPAYVINDFKSQLDELSSYFDRVAAAIVGTPTEQRDLSLLAEQTFVSGAVAFESFLSDLFVAFINRNSSKLQSEYESRIKESVKSKLSQWHADQLRFSAVKHLSVDQIIEIMDKEGRNITFSTALKLKAETSAWLHKDYADLFKNLTAEDEAVIDCMKAVRDFIAHRSVSAKKRMNEELQRIGNTPPNENLGRGLTKVHYIGSFLKAEFQASRRVKRYWIRLKRIAESLRPPAKPTKNKKK